MLFFQYDGAGGDIRKETRFTFNFSAKKSTCEKTALRAAFIVFSGSAFAKAGAGPA
jgi:hypothetical protein